MIATVVEDDQTQWLQRRRGGRGGGEVTAGYILSGRDWEKKGEKVCGGKVSENPPGTNGNGWGTNEEERSSSTVSGGCDRAGCGRARAVARYRRDRGSSERGSNASGGSCAPWWSQPVAAGRRASWRVGRIGR
jgi:hypothetical protein